MLVFVVMALFAALLHIVLFSYADLLGTGVTYAIVGLLCGLVLRTRLVGGVQRMLVVCFFTIGFPLAGLFTLLLLIAEASLEELVFASAFAWGLVAFLASLPYLINEQGRLAPPLLAFACFGAAGGLALFLEYEDFVPFDGAELCVHPVLVCLAAGVFDRLCAMLGLESPQEGFDRLRVRLEFRWR
jgi:hypothetical protein